MPLSSSEKSLQQLNGNPEPIDFAGNNFHQSTDGEVETRSPASIPVESLSDGNVPPLFSVSRQGGGIARWIWVVAFASIGLHAGVLLIPMGEEAKPPPPKPPENQVRITQLPTLKKQPTIKRPPKPVVKRVSASKVSRPQIKTPTAPTVAAASKPPADPLKDEQPGEDSPWKDFPLYPGSTTGCFELPSCLQADADLSQVSAHFAGQLPAKKYEIKRVAQETGRQVYQVTRSGLSQFLSIIENGKKTVYVLSDAPRTLADLEKAVEVPPEIYAILVGLAVQQADASAFAQPNQFYAKADGKGLNAGELVPRSGIRNISLVSGQSADTMMDEFLRSNLQNSDFEVTDIPKQYGGGKVYRATKKSQTLYLNLVPTKDNSGTLLVIWKTPPG
ncbi:MAG: hypothetical protein IGS48_17445 [Oscillatoriales cyanobacterium C42_A2020_001]|nr:hypothetical protein [Leptolyngbyaceae cyanobacterium C42_A2020_001]